MPMQPVPLRRPDSGRTCPAFGLRRKRAGRFWRGLAGVLGLGMAWAGVAQTGAFRILRAERDTAGRPRLEIAGSPEHYFVLYRAANLPGPWEPVLLVLGQDEMQALTDARPLAAAAFYRVQRVPRAVPLDVDRDGIDDLFELAHPTFLDPLNPADAGEDFDGDGVSNLEEYRRGTDPAVPENVTRVEVSPRAGESGVSVNRETVLRFSRPLAAGMVVSNQVLWAEAAGRRWLSRIELSADRRTVTLFYLEPLPGSARVTVTLEGDLLRDLADQPVDGDDDGRPGGRLVVPFETTSLTAVPATAVVGRVFASEPVPGPNGTFINRPLAGVTVTVDGAEETLRAVTDVEGRFRLEPSPAGEFFVHVDGRTSPESQWPDGDYYPFVGKRWSARAGRTDNLAGGSGEIYLPLIRANTLQPVSLTEPTTITFPPEVLAANPGLAGVELRVPPNNLFDEAGNRGGRVGLAPVAPDRLPEPLPPGLNFPLVITVQTDGPQNFDQPVPIRFPNLPDPRTGQRLPSGAKSALWSFNHDTGEWEIAGPMTVTADGQFLETDPGVGIRQPGWHGAQPGAQMNARPRKEPDCPGFGWGDAWDVGKAAFDCIKNMTRVLQLISIAVESINEVKTVASSLTTLRDKYRAGQLDKEGLKAGLELIKAPKDNAVNAYEVLTAQNPVSKALDVAKCASGLVKVLFEKLCNNRDCLGRVIKFLCNTLTPAVNLADALIQKAGDLEKSIRSAPLAALCLSFDALIATTTLPGAQRQLQGRAPAADPDPEILALLDATLADADQFVADMQFAVDGLQPIQDLQHLTQTAYGEAVQALVAQAGLRHAYYRLILPDFEQRGRFNAQGDLSLRLPASTPYRLEAYVPQFNALAVSEGQTPEVGRAGEFAPFRLEFLDDASDRDHDELPDAAEAVLGTDPDNPDSDSDGLLDGAEVRQGTDPLSGLAVATGILGTVPLPGEAQDISIANDLAVVALGSAGVAVVNVFEGLNPTLVSLLPTPHPATAVACGERYAAVACGPAGVAVLDLQAPGGPARRHQVHLGPAVRCVAAAATLGVAGTDTGEVVAFDLASGLQLDRLSLGSPAVQDLVFAGDQLYALTQGRLHVLVFDGGAWLRLGSVESPGNINTAHGRMRLFVGGNIAYAVHNRGYNTLDVQDPAAPRLITFQPLAQFGWKQIVLNGTGLGLAALSPNMAFDGAHHVSLYDVRDPAVVDAFLSEFPTPGVARALALNNGLAWVADHTAGLHVLNYLAYDRQGRPPTIRLEGRFPDHRASEGELKTVTAEVTDDVQVRHVEFYLNGQRVFSDGSYPFEFRFLVPALAEGADRFRIRARAVDTGGNAAWSEELDLAIVPDATPPRLLRTVPEAGAWVGRITQVALFFNEPLDEATATPAAVQLVAAGPDGVFGTADDQLMPVAVEARAALRSVHLLHAGELPPGRYQVRLADTLADLAGNRLAAPARFEFRAFAFDDADQDGLPDELEPSLGYNPAHPDSNGNGIPDGLEDRDGDGLTNSFEVLRSLTNPLLRDSDGNGIPDDLEDPDGDGLNNLREQAAGTDPLVADTDGDGWNDEAEVSGASDPLDPRSVPRLWILARPPALVLRPAVPGAGELPFNTLLARPPALVLRPAVPGAGELPFNTLLARPPALVLRPAVPGAGESPFNTFVGRPPVEVRFNNP